MRLFAYKKGRYAPKELYYLKAFKVSRLPKHTVFSLGKKYLMERKESPVRQSLILLLHTIVCLYTLL
ncbi:hypothetical protein B2G94_03095 [Staphylococcus hominis subsp. hominis]|nr:hypothetical protein B2G94_03095 [Staphylococcus hominis subsp. hominis]